MTNTMDGVAAVTERPVLPGGDGNDMNVILRKTYRSCCMFVWLSYILVCPHRSLQSFDSHLTKQL
jgi:hypothetical protein